MIRYSALRGKWDDDLIFSFQKLDKPTSFKDNVISMDIWEEGLVSYQENYFSSLNQRNYLSSQPIIAIMWYR